MTQRTALCGTTAILIALAGTAHADVTGADVWNNWKAAGESVGQVMTPGSESQDGDTLTITDLQITMDVPEVDVSGAIAKVEFRNNADGTVTMSMSPIYTMSIDATSDDAEDAQIDISVSQEGLTMVASGDPNAITYDFLAASMVISVDSLMVEDEKMDMAATVTLSDIDGKYVVTSGNMTDINSDMTAAKMVVAVDVKEPDGGDGKFVMNADIADIAVSSAGSLMFMADPAAISSALASGMNSSSKITYGATTYDMDFADGRDAFAMQGSNATGALNVSLSGDGLGYSVSNTGIDMSMSGSEIPLPEIAIGMGEFGFSFLMPVAKSDEPGDIGMNFTLRDLSVSDMIWSMIDAGGQLPHDPATLILDLSGKANWLFDIFDPEAAEMDMEIPGELHALDINEMELTVAGASLTGMGTFTFDMDDLQSFDGMPAPTGALDLKLVGGNGLMDTLVAMGLLPEDQAMGARMMMGLFARPGDGEDTLTSKIEIDGATGAISANGQRLQ